MTEADQLSLDERVENYRNLMSKVKQGRRGRGLVRPKEPRYNGEGQQLYCYCQRPDDESFMIQCDTCKDWFHGDCVNLTEDDGEQIDCFICRDCEEFIQQMDTRPEPVEERPKKIKKKEPQENQLRKMATRGLHDTFESIFSEAIDASFVDASEIKINVHDALAFAIKVEEELFKEFSVNGECTEKYKSKYRSLQFNLKDKENKRLRKRILQGVFNPSKLVTLTPEELANEQVREIAAQVRKESIQQSVKIKEKDPVKTQLELLYPQGYDTNNKSSDAVLGQSLVTRTISPMRLPEKKPDQVPSPKQELFANVELTPVFNEAKYDFAMMDDDDDEPVPFSPKTPPGSPPRTPVNELCWRGVVSMPQVARFKGTFSQVAGPMIGSTRIWEDIVPGSISVEGRISIDKVSEYVAAQRSSSSKQIAVVEFESGDSEYSAMFDYFYSRKRYAVAAHPYVSVKDFYLVPVAASEPLPEFLMTVSNNKIATNRLKNTIFGVFVLVRKVLNNVSRAHSPSTTVPTVPAYDPVPIQSPVPIQPPIQQPQLLAPPPQFVPAPVSVPVIDSNSLQMLLSQLSQNPQLFPQ